MQSMNYEHGSFFKNRVINRALYGILSNVNLFEVKKFVSVSNLTLTLRFLGVFLNQLRTVNLRMMLHNIEHLQYSEKQT